MKDKKLIIVESPNKIKKIQSFVGNDYIVMATCGHFLELDDSKFGIGIDISDNFKPFYKIDPNKKDRIKQIVDIAKDCDEIFVCTDNDREGEAIGQHIATFIRQDDKIKRATFNEITKSAVLKALQNPTKIDANKVDSQKARQVMDKIVGYKVSPILWKSIVSKTPLSAGRVQSIGLKIIVDRQREIDKFSKLKYYTIHAKLLNSEDEEFEAEMFLKDKFSITEEDKARKLVEFLKSKDFIVDSIEVKNEKRFPPSVFTTSLLQQAAFSILSFDNDRTMKVAQKLYEEGLITYHRSDSAKISDEALSLTRKYIKENFGDKYLPAKAHFFKSAKGAQEAHECIRPTHIDEIISYFDRESSDEAKLLKLVAKRFLASQIEEALFEKTEVGIQCDKAKFFANGNKKLFDGFLKVWDYYPVEEKILPKLKEKDKLKLKELYYQEHETKPPARFNGASLVKELEKNEVGRPSTYASIVSTLLKREYIKKAQKAFEPTDIGCVVKDFLEKFFYDNILDIKYTANMEELLDKIEAGSSNYVDVLTLMFKDLSERINKVKQDEVISDKCEKCKSSIIIKFGRFGKFPACSNKDCDMKYSFDENNKIVVRKEKEYLAENCPKCGSKMVKRSSKKTSRIFYGCESWPKCNQLADENGEFVKIKKVKKLKKKCPKCGNILVERNGSRGKFAGCSAFPKCTHMEDL